MSASGIPSKIGECVTIKNCAPFLAHLYISIINVNCLCGDNAASGSSKRYNPLGCRLFCANAKKPSPCDLS